MDTCVEAVSHDEAPGLKYPPQDKEKPDLDVGVLLVDGGSGGLFESKEQS